MSAGGYIGMLATLAFVLGLVMLVARLAKRFLPGAVSATGTGTFAVVQRIPLGQRQGIAIVQRGDLLIGVSVGEGGVRTLFTMPVGMPGDVDSSVDVHDDEITVPVTMNAHELASGSMINTGLSAQSLLSLTVAGQPRLVARAGRSGGKLAACVTDGRISDNRIIGSINNADVEPT